MRWGFISSLRSGGSISICLTLMLALLGSGCSSNEDSGANIDAASSGNTAGNDANVAIDAPSGGDTTLPDVSSAKLCTSDDECEAAGATCTCNGECKVFDTNPCVVDKNCPSDQFCDICTGFCDLEVGVCEACTSDPACGDGGACLPFASGGSFCANECLSDLGCEVGYSCIAVDGYQQKLCVPDSGSCADLGLCESDGECPDGQICNENLKICAPGCSEDDQCAGTLVCEAARCVEPCASQADCSPNAECIEGHCKIPGACETGEDCIEPETYCNKTTGQCAPGCLIDSDCQDAANKCENKKCVPKGCIHNYQCAFEQICDKESGACIPTPENHCGICDASSENQCGGDPNLCVTLQDQDPETGDTVDKGDYCLLPCANDPVDQCPQGYSCTQIQNETIDGFYCTRACWVNPVGGS